MTTGVMRIESPKYSVRGDTWTVRGNATARSFLYMLGVKKPSRKLVKRLSEYATVAGAVHGED